MQRGWRNVPFGNDPRQGQVGGKMLEVVPAVPGFAVRNVDIKAGEDQADGRVYCLPHPCTDIDEPAEGSVPLKKPMSSGTPSTGRE